MEIGKCKKCKGMISTKAKFCPHCGTSTKKKNKTSPVTWIFIGFFILFFINIYNLPSNNTTSTSYTESKQYNNTYETVTIETDSDIDFFRQRGIVMWSRHNGKRLAYKYNIPYGTKCDDLEEEECDTPNTCQYKLRCNGKIGWITYHFIKEYH